MSAPEEILRTEFSEDFVRYMKNRMIFSYHKYGQIKDAYPHKVDAIASDAIASLKTRLGKYEADGNTEWLVDLANFAMIEFLFPRHPTAHFQPTDSDKSPGRTTIEGKQTQKANNEIGAG